MLSGGGRRARPTGAKGLQSWGPATPAALSSRQSRPRTARLKSCQERNAWQREKTSVGCRSHLSSSRSCASPPEEEDPVRPGGPGAGRAAFACQSRAPDSSTSTSGVWVQGLPGQAQSSSGGLCVRGDACWMPSSSSGPGSLSSFLCLLLLPPGALARLLFFLDFFPPSAAVSPFLPDHCSARQPAVRRRDWFAGRGALLGELPAVAAGMAA